MSVARVLPETGCGFDAGLAAFQLLAGDGLPKGGGFPHST